MTDRVLAISSIIRMEAIDKVRQDRDALLASCFTTEEQQELSSRHVRSTAGYLALKRAIANLLAEKWNVELPEKDIPITRSDSGRPILDLKQSRMNTIPAIEPCNLFLSISHSRTTAYGLAVYQELNHA